MLLADPSICVAVASVEAFFVVRHELVPNKETQPFESRSLYHKKQNGNTKYCLTCAYPFAST